MRKVYLQVCEAPGEYPRLPEPPDDMLLIRVLRASQRPSRNEKRRVVGCAPENFLAAALRQ
jgi:hypothetical protein